MRLKKKNLVLIVTNAFINIKINGAKNRILNITNLATTTALTAVEYKITDHSKIITIPEFNKLTVEHFTAILKQANLATKVDDKLKNLNKKVTSSKSKYYPVENETSK